MTKQWKHDIADSKTTIKQPAVACRMDFTKKVKSKIA